MEAAQCIGLWVRTIRKRRGLTQAKLAELIGRLPNAVSALECGKNLPTLDTLDRIAEALGVPMRDFLAPVEEADGAKHDALCGELLDTARTLPLADLQMAVDLVGIVAKRHGVGRPAPAPS